MVCCRGLDNNPVVTTSINCWFLKIVTCVKDRINTFTLEEFYKLYIQEIVQLHGVPVSIVSNRDPRFTSHFWKSFKKAMGTQLIMSTAFHP